MRKTEIEKLDREKSHGNNCKEKDREHMEIIHSCKHTLESIHYMENVQLKSES